MLFLRDRLAENPNAQFVGKSTIGEQIQKYLGKIQKSWQSVDIVWESLPSNLQNWGIFQSTVEEMSDGHLLNVSAGESKNQITIRGEHYGSIRRN